MHREVKRKQIGRLDKSGGRREIASLDHLLRRAGDRDLLRVLGLQRLALGRGAVPHHQRAPALGRNKGEAPGVKGQVCIFDATSGGTLELSTNGFQCTG